jgi:L-ribulose-5-phosphate 3-epimerase
MFDRRMSPSPTLTRRRFLRTSAAVVAVSAASARLTTVANAANSRSAKKRDLKKGYMLNTFPGPPSTSLLDQFQMLKQAGFDGVEPRSHLNQDEVLRARDATGLSIPSVTCGTHSRLLAQPAASQRKAGVDGIQQALRDAKRYGASSILVVPGIVSESITYAENYERTQAGIRECLPLAEELCFVMAM